MNRIDKPKRTSRELVEMLKNEKGVTFKYTSEDKAKKYLEDVNNYLRTASYRKNYQKLSKISKWKEFKRKVYRFGFCLSSGIVYNRHAFEKYRYKDVY